MRPHVILRYVGLILLLNSVFLLASTMISFFDSDTALFPLLYSSVIAAIFGFFPLIFVPPTENISNNEGFIIVISSWFLSCLIGLLPYVLWGGEFTLTNAWFESVSGFTTTGSSILTDIEALPRGLLFWRASTHFIGGIGIIVFALSVLPFMGRAGMILYRAEISPLAKENFSYRTKKTLQILMFVYIGLTLLESIALLLCGMNLFDSITHSFATIATGGFSTKNLSIAHYNSFSIEVVIMAFMILSGIHFGLLFSAVSGNVRTIWKSSIVKFYLLMLFAGILLTTFNVYRSSFKTLKESLHYAAFQIISIGTSTGFATTDSSIWPSFAQLILIFFTLQCACAGSTSGGIKVDRTVIFFKALAKRIMKLRHAEAVIKVKIDGTTIDDDLLETNILYISLYIGIVFLSSLLLTSLGVDSLSAFSGSAATMGNVGPGLGMVGSVGNFSQIPNLGKWVLTATMLLGRLEIFGLILLFMVRSWK